MAGMIGCEKEINRKRENVWKQKDLTRGPIFKTMLYVCPTDDIGQYSSTVLMGLWTRGLSENLSVQTPLPLWDRLCTYDLSDIYNIGTFAWEAA